LTGFDSRNPDVPDVAGAVPRWIQIDGASRRRVFGMIKQLEAYAVRVPAEKREVDSTSHFPSAQGRWAASSNFRVFANSRDVLI
jgi:hypothetical protein